MTRFLRPAAAAPYAVDVSQQSSKEDMSENNISSITPRIFFDEAISIITPDGKDPLIGRALNLSRGGVYVCTPSLLPEAQRVQLQFRLPDGEPVTLEATVIRTVPGEDGREPGGMALRFESVEPDYSQRIDRFIKSRIQPCTGEPIRLEFSELGVPIKARTQSYWRGYLSVDAELPFLSLGSDVSLQLPGSLQTDVGAIRWVSIDVPPDTGIPRLNIGVEIAEHPQRIMLEEDTDPVCNAEFAMDSAQLDQEVRSRRRAVG